jgi:pyridoxine 5-phosphate synthase
MTRLSVNVNRVALLRNSRPLDYPSPLALSRVALEAGAHGITVHPRPDERHIRPGDVDDIAALLREPAFAGREFNIEGNPFEGAFMDHCRRTRPAQATLVPDTPDQATSDHGWDVSAHAAALRPVIAELRALGCRVSLFVDADADALPEAAAVGADRVELYTEPYAAAFAAGGEALEAALRTYSRAAVAAQAAGLTVNAGHDLTTRNLGPLLKSAPGIVEVSIGHALIADALELGMAGAVRAYLAVIAAV